MYVYTHIILVIFGNFLSKEVLISLQKKQFLKFIFISHTMWALSNVVIKYRFGSYHQVFFYLEKIN